MMRNWKQKAKKILAAVICMAGVAVMPVRAEGEVIFHVENQKGKAGDTVKVPVELNSGEEVGGFDFTVYYDSAAMEFQDLEKGDLIVEENGLFDYNHLKEESAVKIIYVVADTVKAEGVIAELEFKLKKDCESELPIGMEVNEVLDNSEESAAIEGKAEGVSEEFQKTVTGASANTTETVTEENEAGQGETEKTDASQETVSEGSESAEPEEEGKDGKKEEKQKKENDTGKVVMWAIAGIAVIAAVAGVIGRVRKR